MSAAGTYAFRCELCGEVDLRVLLWRIDRLADATCSWACTEHIEQVVNRLRRPGQGDAISIRAASS